MINVSKEVQMFRGEIRKSSGFAVPLVFVTNTGIHPELVNVTHNIKITSLAFLRGNSKV